MYVTWYAHWRRGKWQPPPVLLPEKSLGWRSLVGYSPWGHKELNMDATEWLHFLSFYSSFWRRKWQPTPMFLPGECHGQRGLVGYSLWGCRESDITKQLTHTHTHTHIHTHWNDPVGQIQQHVSSSLDCLSHCLHAQSCLIFCNSMGYSPPVPLSKKFSRQEYWSGLPFPPPWDLSDPGIKPTSLVSSACQVDSLPFCHLGSPSERLGSFYSNRFPVKE